MNDLIWAGIWAMFLKNAIEIAQVMGIALAWLIFALMCLAQLGKLYDWIKRECDLERLLDTPQKRKDLKMEGKTTYCDPEDEEPLMKMCQVCGELYHEHRERCIYDGEILLYYKKRITEPLIKRSEERRVGKEEEDAAHIATEQELQAIWTALEDKAREYNVKRPHTFSREEVINLRKVYDKVREQSHEGKRAS